MPRYRPETYLKFLRKHFFRFSGNTILKTRFRNYIAETFGAHQRTYERNCAAMMQLGMISDGGAVWIISERIYSQIAKEIEEGVEMHD